MVNISNTPPVTPTVPKTRDKVAEVEPHSDERRATPRPKPLVERRKQPDRRRGQQQRPVYDMRASRGRRKTDRGGHSSIDVDA